MDIGRLQISHVSTANERQGARGIMPLSEREPRNGTEMDRSKLVSLTFFSAAPHLQLDGSISISMKVKGIETSKCVVGLFLPGPVC